MSTELLEVRKAIHETNATRMMAEWVACAKSPWSFVTRHCYTEDPHDYQKPLKRFPVKKYLYLTVQAWFKNQVLAIVKSRQMMVTWLCLALHLWLAMFRNSQRIYIQTQDKDGAEELIDRMKFIYDHLHPWFKNKCKMIKFTKDELLFSNRSQVLGLAKGGHQIRQKCASAIMTDEFAFQDEADEAYRAMRPTIAGGGKLTMISSAETGFFCELVHDREGISGEANQ